VIVASRKNLLLNLTAFFDRQAVSFHVFLINCCLNIRIRYGSADQCGLDKTA